MWDLCGRQTQREPAGLWAQVTGKAGDMFEYILLEKTEERERRTGLGKTSWRNSYWSPRRFRVPKGEEARRGTPGGRSYTRCTLGAVSVQLSCLGERQLCSSSCPVLQQWNLRMKPLSSVLPSIPLRTVLPSDCLLLLLNGFDRSRASTHQDANLCLWLLTNWFVVQTVAHGNLSCQMTSAWRG